MGIRAFFAGVADVIPSRFHASTLDQRANFRVIPIDRGVSDCGGLRHRKRGRVFEFQVPPGEFEGYIFDCDGTLVDSMPAHFRAWTQALAEFGQPDIFPEDVFYGMGGVPTLQIVRDLNAAHGIELDPVAVTDRKEILVDALLATVQPIVDVVACARSVAAMAPVSVASGGHREVVLRTLRLAGIDSLFPIVVAAEDVKRGKPAPDCFLLAAEQMGVPPGRCLVFEDGIKGIEAARAAGMQTVLVSRRRTS
jgi:beta-phosphoglucomutase-like phosphatase (HAD superfamily)